MPSNRPKRPRATEVTGTDQPVSRSGPSVAYVANAGTPARPQWTTFREFVAKLPATTPHSHAFVVEEASAIAPEQSESVIQQLGMHCAHCRIQKRISDV